MFNTLGVFKSCVVGSDSIILSYPCGITTILEAANG